MDAWWRAEPLRADEQILLNTLFRAHSESSFRPSGSSVAVANAAAGSGDIGKAIVAGILTLGGKHAPLEQTFHFIALDRPSEKVAAILQAGQKVPGWGGTFQQDQPDPLWNAMDTALRKFQPQLAARLDEVTKELLWQGKTLYPNPSAYTAAVAVALGLPARLAVYLFISARIDAWAQIAASQTG
jgi:citrate synthase